MSESRSRVPEFTLKAIVAGVVLGIVFGAANAYLGLRLGMTVSASIPAAVMTVALFRLTGRRGTILEANLSQTIGSASTALATGTIFTVPALFLWGVVPPYLQVVALCFLGGVLGIAAMIPLRRLLIVREHETLPYPEGTACAEVLRATTSGAPGSAWIFRGMALGAGIKLAIALLFLVPESLGAELAFLPKARVAIEIAPAMIAVGFILGYRQSGILVAGAVLSALALTPLIAWVGESVSRPLAPETTMLVRDMAPDVIWKKYVKYIGAGAVAFAGILTVLRNLPSMFDAVRSVLRGLRSSTRQADEALDRTDRDLPGWFVVGGVFFVVLVAAFVPGVFSGGMTLGQRLVCATAVALFGVLFVTVAARIVGIVGVSSQPTSGITLVTLIAVASVFVAAGWTDVGSRAAVLTVGTVVAIAASKAGDISQDLKTGFLVGATPAKQQLGQLIGASFACWAVAATVLLLGKSYTFGDKDFPAPQATLMKTVIEGLLAGQLPWNLLLSGAGISAAAMLCGISGLAFAIGVYLPLASMAPIFLGGCMRALTLRGKSSASAPAHGDPGVLAASGLVAGEGLAGVLVAGLVGMGWVRKEGELVLGGAWGATGGALLLLFVCAFLWRSSRRAPASR
jgi:putative OPT family oligopeptide transporter